MHKADLPDQLDTEKLSFSLLHKTRGIILRL
jgi:hypothetical protein